MKKTGILTLLLVLAALGTSQAETLTLAESLDKALTTHPDVKRFILQTRLSEQGIDVVRSEYLPQITVNGEYDLSKTYVFPANGSFNTTNSDGWQAGITLKQKIWDFSKTRSLIKAQEADREVAELSLQDARALLAYKVKLQYELARVQQKAIDVRNKDYGVKKALYNQAKALVDQGLRTTADETRFASSTSVAKDNLAIAKANFAKALNSLSLYIGEPIAQDVVLEEPASTLVTFLPTEEEILKNSPLLRSLQEKMRKSELLYNASKSSRYGSIDGVASYTYQDTLNEYDTALVGVMLTVPLYSGGRLSAQQEQAAINRQSAKNDFYAKELSLKEEIRSLLIDLQRYGQTIEAKTLQYTAASQTRDVVSGRYTEGLATYIEVLDATAQMLDARLGLLQATYDRNKTVHRLEYLQGKSK